MSVHFFDCDSLTSINIGDSVKTIGHYAFFNCDLLTAVSIGDSVETIGNNAFYSCDSLTSITIPNSVTTIGDTAFCDCTSLTNVYYAGTQEQWKKIIGSNDGYMTNATIHYNHIHNYSLLPPFTEPATCTQAGYTEYTCAYGETYREVLPALPHDYTGGKKVIAPTCTEDGYTAEFCTRCNAIESKYNITPALGHKMVLAPAVAPTCAETGLTAGTCCERCQIVGVSQEIVPATGHSFADGICTVCGAPECSPGDLDSVEGVNEDDVIYLLQHLLMPEEFPLS